MTEVDQVARSGQPTESAGLTARPPLTLAEEHVLLLWQAVARRGTGGAGWLRPGRGAAPGV